jgi:PAS domain S-box-containing protein
MTDAMILIVDDDPALLQALPEALSLRMPGLMIETADSAVAALERIRQTDYDAILSDIKMPGMDGLALLKQVRVLRPETPTLLITGHGEHDLAIQALRGGAYDFIQKPIDREYVVASLKRAISMRSLSREVQEQRLALEQHAATLEQTVQERTRSLVEANAAKDELISRVAALAELLQQRAIELDTIIESIADGVYVCDAQGKIIRVNANGAALTGLTPEQALQTIAAYGETNDFRSLDGTPLPPEEHPLAQALRGITRTDYRFVMRRSDTGSDIQVRVSAAPIRNSAGEITGAVAVASDISKVYELERQKEEFLSIASHELRTPLTSLKTLMQLTQRQLARAGVPMERNLARMERSIARMEQLIDDLLDVSRIQAGKLAIRPEPCELQALCQQIMDEQGATTERKLLFDAPDEPIEVEVDIDRIGQVVTNLLSNALKYSPPERPVTLSLRREGDRALIAVHDEGSGIPAEELPHIFDRFYRVPGVEVKSGSTVGLGLGLYICQEIVERHGGHIWAESTLGQGSTFSVSLPLVAGPIGQPRGGAHGHDSSATHQDRR